jgi:hypothetical protein
LKHVRLRLARRSLLGPHRARQDAELILHVMAEFGAMGFREFAGVAV